MKISKYHFAGFAMCFATRSMLITCILIGRKRKRLRGKREEKEGGMDRQGERGRERERDNQGGRGREGEEGKGKRGGKKRKGETGMAAVTPTTCNIRRRTGGRKHEHIA